MSARDDVLAAVRRALADADRAAPTAPTAPTVPRGYRDLQMAPDGLAALFAERVEEYRASVVRCSPDEVEEVIASTLGARRAVVPPALPWHVAGSVPDDGLTAYQLDEVDAVVTAAALGIAQTGTVVLDHGPDQGRRAISLVPDVHVCVVRTDQLVAGVPDAVARLDPARPQTWISGPSATSDIELARVEGVHGPRTLHVVLAGA